MTANIISFKNPGLVDPRAYRVFGVNAKTSTNAIGEFGTGMKYMIAVALRLGAKVTIWRGLDKTILTTKEDSFRDKDFNFVVDQDGTELPFTTHLGHKWEPWMAFREAYCNAIDEGGSVGRLEDNFPEEGHTVITIEGSDDLWQCYLERDTIVLPSHLEPLYTSNNGSVIVYPGMSEYLYRRGVRADTCQPASSFTYDFPNADLTEDRTFKYQWSSIYDLSRVIVEEFPVHLLDRVLDASRMGWERILGFGGVPSKGFINKAQQRLNNKQYLPDKVLSLLVSNKSSQQMIDEMKTIQPSVFEEKIIEDVARMMDSTGLSIQRSALAFKESLPGSARSLASSGMIYISKEALSAPDRLSHEIIKHQVQQRYECGPIGTTGFDTACVEEILRLIKLFKQEG